MKYVSNHVGLYFVQRSDLYLIYSTMIPYLKKRRLEDEDDHKININDIWDLRYWADRFGVIPEILQDAITSVGTESAEIREWLLAHGHIDATE